MTSSSWIATMPANRRIALRSQRKPKSSRSTPTIALSSASGTTVTIATPSVPMMTANVSSAASVPTSGARHPRVTPTARTIVMASTNSTALAAKEGSTAVTSARLVSMSTILAETAGTREGGVIARARSLRNVGRDREDAAAGQRESHALLDVGGDARAERAKRLLGYGATLRRQHVGGIAPELRIRRGQVQSDALAEQPAGVPRVVQEHRREAGAGGEENLHVGVAEAEDQRDRRAHVPKGVHAA